MEGILTEKLGSAEKALRTLDEVLKEPFSKIVRDAAIQRFEYTFESVWKLLKTHLEIVERSPCQSPAKCFREGVKSGLLAPQEAEECLKMLRSRNLTAHTYMEVIAQDLYGKLGAYHRLMALLVDRIRHGRS